MTKTLRNVERKILSYLELDARTPLSKIGKLIRKSQQQVSYTVQSLEKKGIIRKFFTIIDYSKLDLFLFRVYFKVAYTREKTFENVIKYLKEDSYTSWIEECGSPYDLLCTFFSPNPSQFNKHIRLIMEKFPKQLQNYTVLTSVIERKFKRTYLNPKINYEEHYVGGDRKPEKLDEKDMKLLSSLSQDARLSSVVLGNQLKITPKTVINRIKELEKKKIILGYKTLLDLREVGNTSSLLLVKYHNITTAMEKSFINYLKAHPNIPNIVKTLGEWDVEILVEVEDHKLIRKTEREIRENFGQLIQVIQSVPLYATHKKNYFPEFLDL